MEDIELEPVRDADALLLDSKGFGADQYCGVYLLPGTPGAIVETAASPTADRVIQGAGLAGMARDEVRYVFVTHIHLDHCGAAWRLLEAFPNAEVVVHERGAPYLTDPEKVDDLLASTKRAVGEERFPEYGTLEPIDRARAITVSGGETFDVGGRTLEVHDAPGHAPHHYVLMDPDSSALFAGDVLGIQVPDGPLLMTTPPPRFDYDKWRMTLDRIAKLDPRTACLTHYGAFDAPDLLRRFRERFESWVGGIYDCFEEGLSEEETVEKMMAAHDEGRQAWGDHFAEEIRMNVRGVWLYLEQEAE